jgi:RNA polymerase sigma-70 factor (ECF subfamily)
MKLPRRGTGHAPDHRRLGDEDLMALVRGGDAAAFEVIYERHGGVAFSLALRMCGRRPAAEDVVQEAFLSAWRRSSSYDAARGSVRTWLLGIVHHRAVDALRRSGNDGRRRVDVPVEELDFDADVHVDAEVFAREEAGLVRGALADLPPEQSRVVELAYFGGFTHSEIAEMLGVPIGTIKGRMRLALTKLRTRFEPLEVPS